MEANQEALDLDLMNAYVAVENYRAEDALKFLHKVDFSRLSSELKAIYHSISGQAKILLKDYETGLTALQNALELLETDVKATPLQVERVRNWIGIGYYDQGDINRAIEQHRRCLQAVLDNKIEDTRFRLKLFLNLGNDYLLLGDRKRALDFYRQGLNLAEKEEDREDLAGIYWAIGLAYRSHNNLDRAKLYLGKSAEQFQEIGDERQRARVRNLLGLVMVERKEFKAAEQTLKAAFETAIAFKEKDLVTLISASTNLAFLYKQQKDWVEAEKWGETSLSYATKLGNDLLQLSQTQAELAEIKLALGKEEETIELFNQATVNIERTGVADIRKQIYFRYGKTLEQLGRLEEAITIMNKSFQKP